MVVARSTLCFQSSLKTLARAPRAVSDRRHEKTTQHTQRSDRNEEEAEQIQSEPDGAAGGAAGGSFKQVWGNAWTEAPGDFEPWVLFSVKTYVPGFVSSFQADPGPLGSHGNSALINIGPDDAVRQTERADETF